jgi:hypothetical protein
MAEVPKELKFLLFEQGAKWHAIEALVFNFLGLACLIMGIISGVMDRALGLWAIYWFPIAIALWIGGLWAWLRAYFAAKEG